MKKEKKLLDESQLYEIDLLKKELQDHIIKYGQFKGFVKVAKDAIIIADALINSDLKTFKKYKLKYTKHTAEKMKGFYSLSTYKKVSSICRFLSQHNGICSKCYAERSLKLYEATLKATLIYNTLLLKYIDIDPSQIDYINDKYFRFEAFSDLQSSKHFKNLLTICKKNKNTTFTLWTKAGYTLVDMIKKEGIKKLPSNLNIVVSEFYINKATNKEYLNGLQTCLYPMQALKGRYTNALKAFIVYDDEKTRLNSGFYQCKKSCLNCLKCYKKSKDIIYIAEKLR